MAITYKLYGQDGVEKTVTTNTDKQEHLDSGFYSENPPSAAKTSGMDMSKLGELKPESKHESESESNSSFKKNSSKPKRRGM